MVRVGFSRKKTTKASEIKTGRFPVDRLPAMTDEMIWKGTGGNVEEVDMPAAGVETFKLSTVFETIARFTNALVNGGTVTFTAGGVTIACGAVATASADCRFHANSSFDVYGSVTGLNVLFTAMRRYSSFAVTAHSYFGVGAVTVAGAGITFTPKHFGFKILRVASADTVYATQADGAAETATAIASTTGLGVDASVYAVLTVGVNIKYYESGVLKATQANNMPTLLAQVLMEFAVSNAGDNVNTNLLMTGACYEQVVVA